VNPLFAILTPFTTNGQIEFAALTDYLSFLQQQGVKTIITNGTTGEFPSLSLEERMTLVEHCRLNFNGNLLNNISSCCIDDCLKLAQHSENYADALVLLPPYYYAHSSTNGLLAFFRAILKHTRLPLYLYHFPKHTNNSITPHLVQTLLTDYPQLMGIKDSEANLAISRQFKTLKSGTFQVFVGGDRIALEVLKNGLDGSVTGGGNPFPELLLSLVHCFQTGDLAQAATHQAALDIWNQFRKQTNLGEISLTKIAMRNRLSHFPTSVRPPLQEVSSETIVTINAFIKQKILPLISGDPS